MRPLKRKLFTSSKREVLKNCVLRSKIIEMRILIKDLIMTYFGVFHGHLDPINQSNLNSSISKHIFSLALFAMIFICLYGTVGQLAATDGNSYHSSPYVFPHLVTPQTIWPQLEISFAIVSIGTVCVFETLISLKPIRERYKITWTQHLMLKMGTIGKCRRDLA